MRTPALDLWRREIAAGQRTTSTFDEVWRAACAEANALEFRTIPELAAACQAEARQIILEAAKQQQRQGAA